MYNILFNKALKILSRKKSLPPWKLLVIFYLKKELIKFSEKGEKMFVEINCILTLVIQFDVEKKSFSLFYQQTDPGSRS